MKQNVTFEQIPSVLSNLVEKVEILISKVSAESPNIQLENEYFTVNEVKKILGVKEGALHNYKVSGDLIPTGKGKYRRYRKEDVKNFLDAKRA